MNQNCLVSLPHAPAILSHKQPFCDHEINTSLSPFGHFNRSEIPIVQRILNHSEVGHRSMFASDISPRRCPSFRDTEATSAERFDASVDAIAAT